MSKPQFTGGPWTVTRHFALEGFSVQRQAAHEHDEQTGVALVTDYVGPNGEFIQRGPDAHLISAAPDMYEALVSTLHVLEVLEQDAGYRSPTCDKIRAALAKAEGRS